MPWLHSWSMNFLLIGHKAYQNRRLPPLLFWGWLNSTAQLCQKRLQILHRLWIAGPPRTHTYKYESEVVFWNCPQHLKLSVMWCKPNLEGQLCQTCRWPVPWHKWLNYKRLLGKAKTSRNVGIADQGNPRQIPTSTTRRPGNFIYPCRYWDRVVCRF